MGIQDRARYFEMEQARPLHAVSYPEGKQRVSSGGWEDIVMTNGRVDFWKLRFAWLPVELSMGKRIWLKRYWHRGDRKVLADIRSWR